MRLPQPILDINFVPNAATPAIITFSRADAATCATYEDACGLIQTVAANVFRDAYNDAGVFLGKRVEDARANRITYARDLSNAAWVKTNMTATKTATGVDGQANSASVLTATGANGTVAFTFALAAVDHALSLMVKRLVGTGAVLMSMDNGVTWTDITSQLSTSSWTRPWFFQNTANPTVIIKLATSGDSIAVDYVQIEDGKTPTSPILTAGAAATRVADYPYVTLSGLVDYQGKPLFRADQWTLVVEASIDYLGATATFPTLASLYADATHYMSVFVSDAVNDALKVSVVDGTTQASFDVTPGAIVPGNIYRVGMSASLNNFSGCCNGGNVVQDLAGTMPTPTILGLAHVANLYRLNGCLRRLTLWNRDLYRYLKTLTTVQQFNVSGLN